MDVVCALDIGGSNLRICILQASTGRELSRRTIPSRGDDYDSSLNETEIVARQLTQGHTLVSVGAGVAGAVTNGVITGSGNLPDWILHNYQADLEEKFGVSVTVLNDCAAAALGEYVVFQRPLIYVIWGTGVGVSVVSIVDGHMTVRATELGHMVIHRSSRLQCGWGGRGHLEALVSGNNIPRRFRRLWIFKGRKAEELSDRQWTRVLRDMAVGLRNLSAGDMGLPIVLGGGILIKQSHRLPQLQEMVGNLPSTCPVPELLIAEGGEDSGLLGAAYAARQLIAA